jgi:hypothetical protein
MASQNTPSSDQDRAAELAAALSEQRLNQLSWAASNYYQRDPIAAAVGDSPAKTVRDLFSAWGRGDAQSVALVEMLQAFDKGIQSLYIDNGNLSTELQTLRTQAAGAAQLAADNTKLRDTLSDTQTKLSASFTQITDLGVRVTHLSGQSASSLNGMRHCKPNSRRLKPPSPSTALQLLSIPISRLPSAASQQTQINSTPATKMLQRDSRNSRSGNIRLRPCLHKTGTTSTPSSPASSTAASCFPALRSMRFRPACRRSLTTKTTVRSGPGSPCLDFSNPLVAPTSSSVQSNRLETSSTQCTREGSLSKNGLLLYSLY